MTEIGTLELILALLGVLFTVYATYDLAKHKRIDEFRANFSSLNYNRSMYSHNMREAYSRIDDDSAVCPNSYLLKPAGDVAPWEPEEPRPITPDDSTSVVIEAVPGKNQFRGVEFVRGDLGGRGRFQYYRFRCLPNPSRLYSYNSRRYLSKKVFDGELYHALKVCGREEKVVLEVGLSSYYSYYNTCEVLAFMAVYRQNRMLEGGWGSRSSKGDMEGRIASATDKTVIDAFDLGNRCVGIGVCTLTLLLNVDGVPGNNFFLVHHRSDRVAEAMNTVSLVPAGSLQPNYAHDSLLSGSDGSVDRSRDLYLNILREFEEEVLGRKEAEFADSFTARVIRGIEAHYVTMGLDPLTTKMEMVTVLTMDCHDREVIEYIGGLVPGVDSDTPYLTARDLDGVLAHASSEGRITMEPFTKTMVTRYESYSEAMPLFRECMRLVNKHSRGFFKDLLRE